VWRISLPLSCVTLLTLLTVRRLADACVNSVSSVMGPTHTKDTAYREGRDDFRLASRTAGWAQRAAARLWEELQMAEWSDAELRSAVSAYLEMLSAQVGGAPYSN
jgi:hypothetical protein